MNVPLKPRNTRQQMLDKIKDLQCRKLLDAAQNPPKDKK